ncbi:MAG: acyl-CoA/acyl-ACP dehydrogenase [Rhodobacteraceae bacterium]|nr:acyl-CoA/acyl-ACP dehydrogenase [Paracoccaceae bacterium]
MALDAKSTETAARTNPTLPNLLALCAEALDSAESVLEIARTAVRDRVVADGKISSLMLETEQHAAHGFAWVATYVEALRQMLGWARRLEQQDAFGELEQLMLQVAFGEYLAQLQGGVPMSQVEVVRLRDLGVTDPAVFATPSVYRLVSEGNTDSARARIVELALQRGGAGTFGATGLDEEFEMIREQFLRFCEERVTPHAHGWHLRDELIPIDVVEAMAEMGVFGLTIPEEYGGFGMSKTAMCVVSEELSRGYIGVGSLGTRSEIAAELILCGGTEEQKREWLPKIASAETLPTAVFTEPNTGSDLGSLRTRAVKDGEEYVVTGNKTWITHAARTDVMTLLARTDPDSADWRGLSMFLAPKTRGDCDTPFPDDGVSGGEIEVLGYRGMKEYELALDGFRVPASNLLGGVEGLGFKHLMQTFESARVQTAARAVGVAQSALDISMRYAQERVQFGKALINFPRVYGKVAMMIVETMIGRQLTYFSAREKDADRRCDLEAGMAKLLCARIAWAAADNGLQIHGGNGFALEYPISRVLCDARILNIFEGAAEIQAQVIARRLLESNN